MGTAEYDEDCEHLSSSGIDQTPTTDEAKVWRCDACGWLYRSVRPDGAPSMVRVMQALIPSDSESGEGS